MKFLIAGLGNIGPEYELTRHNIGFLTLDRMAETHKAIFATTRLADKAEFKYKGKQIHLIKPNTYMNLSGRAVSYWMNDLKISRDNLLVVVDATRPSTRPVCERCSIGLRRRTTLSTA